MSDKCPRRHIMSTKAWKKIRLPEELEIVAVSVIHETKMMHFHCTIFLTYFLVNTDTKTSATSFWNPNTHDYRMFQTIAPPNFRRQVIHTTPPDQHWDTILPSEVVRIGSIIIFHLSEYEKPTSFFILCGVIFLVRLQGKFEIDHPCRSKRDQPLLPWLGPECNSKMTDRYWFLDI